MGSVKSEILAFLRGMIPTQLQIEWGAAASAFVSYDIIGNDTIRMWVASTAEDMSQNRTFKVRCVVVGY